MLEVRGLCISVGDRTLLRDLNLTIEHGQSWAVLGPNGAGKSTLLHTLAGLRRANAGHILLNECDIALLSDRELARERGLLFQGDATSADASVWEVVLAGRYARHGAWSQPDEQDRQAALSAMRRCAIDALAQRELGGLSGGEQRLVMLAQLLAQDPDLALVDEPANHLDLRHQRQAYTVLGTAFRRVNRCLVTVSHDPNAAMDLADHWLLLDGNGGWQAGTVDEMASVERLTALYDYPFALLENGQRAFFVPAEDP